MKRVKISFGGSHRKNARCIAALRPFTDGSTFLPASLGSKRLIGTAFDTQEMRDTLKRLGGSVCRFQPSWLNERESNV